MNFVEEERVYCNREEEQEEEEEEEEEEESVMASSLPFSSPSSSSSSIKHKSNFQQQHHNLCFGSIESQQDYKKNTEAAVVNFGQKLELMDLSLRNTNNIETADVSPGGAAGGGASGSIEREHMFDKVVTPSDVGKLNRLVIPKQHAEKYFPLDSSSNEKGLLLNFEDRNGKPWRFRYSYWNSSQSYVMTKGWSRFVKEKKLDAGDIVSFQRGVGESFKHRLFIDWRRRPNAPDPTSFAHLDLQNQLVHFPHPSSVRWGRFYSLPQRLSMSPQFEQPQILQHPLSYSSTVHQPYNHQHQHQHQHHHHHHNHNHQYYYPQQPQHATSSYGNAAQYYITSALPGEAYHQIGSVPVHQQGWDHHSSMVIDSVPVVHGKTVGKRLRLFGVNVECPIDQDESSSSVTITHGGTVGSFSPHLPSSSSPPPLQMPTMQPESEFSKKGKTSLSFDLEL